MFTVLRHFRSSYKVVFGHLHLVILTTLVYSFPIYITESMVMVNRTTSGPISVLRYVVDKGLNVLLYKIKSSGSRSHPYPQTGRAE